MTSSERSADRRVAVHFLLFDGADLPSVLPLMRRLLDHPRLRPVFVRGFSYGEHEGRIAPVELPREIPQLDIEAGVASGDGAALRERFRQAAEQPAADLRQELLRQLHRDELERPYMPLVTDRFVAVRAGLERLAQVERPRLAVLSDDTSYLQGRLAAAVLGAHGVTTIVASPTYYSVVTTVPLVGRRLADHYFVGNREEMRRLVAAGVDAGRCHTWGSGRFAAPAARWGRGPGRRVLFALQGRAWEAQIVADLIGVCARRAQLEVLVKPHPRVDAARLRDELVGAGLANLRVVDGAIGTLLAEVDAVIGQSTSVLYQAALRGLPIVVVHYDVTPLEIFLPPADGARVVARHRGELEMRLDECLAGRLLPVDPGELVAHRGDTSADLVACFERLLG